MNNHKHRYVIIRKENKNACFPTFDPSAVATPGQLPTGFEVPRPPPEGAPSLGNVY